MFALRQAFSVANSLFNPKTLLLSSRIPSILHRDEQIRGIKMRKVLELRCKSCRFEKINDLWHVVCDEFGRHKQVEWSTKEHQRDKWIMTHITRTGKPFMKKLEAYIIGTCPPGPFDFKPKIGCYNRIKPKYLYPFEGLPPKTKLRNFPKSLN